jgi:hypothetical protein
MPHAAAETLAEPVRPAGPIGAPYPADAKAYDPVAAERFYGARLVVVVSRLVRLTSLTFAFNIRLLLDYQAYKRAGSPEGESWPNERDRAKEVADADRTSPALAPIAPHQPWSQPNAPCCPGQGSPRR